MTLTDYRRLLENHRKAMRLTFIRSYMRSGLSYLAACERLTAIQANARKRLPVIHPDAKG